MLISIIIAAYNVDKYIEKCIMSCENQDVDKSKYEVIVVNDGSTDNTPKIINDLEKKYINIKAFHNNNQGLGATRNYGLQKSKGDYVWFIDGDDYIKENVLKSIVNHIYDNKLDVLLVNYSIVNEEYNLINTDNIKFNPYNTIFTGSEFYSTEYEKSYSWMFLFNSSLFKKYNVFFLNKINMQDSEILPKLLVHTKRMSFYNESIYYYVMRDESFTNSQDCEKRYKYFESIIEVDKSLHLSLIDFQYDKLLIQGIEKKIDLLKMVMFNHFVYFKYNTRCLKRIIKLLKQHSYYPFRNNVKGKMKIVKILINTFPIFAKRILNILR